eukprot:SAG11_NODE_260_length_11531_cov_6.271781_15_plen_198_part_00
MAGVWRVDAAASARGNRMEDERGRGRIAQIVADGAAILAGWLAQARARLDQFYWGVWGSARRVKASARELDVLSAAVWQAEYGDWYEDLPGGRNWLAAAAAVEEDGGQLGGGGETNGCHGCSADAMQDRRTDSDSASDCGGLGVDADVDGRRTTDGGRAGLGWPVAAMEEAHGGCGSRTMSAGGWMRSADRRRSRGR